MNHSNRHSIVLKQISRKHEDFKTNILFQIEENTLNYSLYFKNSIYLII